VDDSVRPVSAGTALSEQVATGAPPLTEADADLGIVGRFRQMVEAVPKAIAVSDEHEELTFHCLAERTAWVMDAVQAAVGALGGPLVRITEGAAGGPDPVAVLHGHQVSAVAAILGVTATGHPVQVLDTRNPVARLQQFVEQAGARVVVCDPAMAEVATQLADQVVVVGPESGGVPIERLWADPVDPDAVATLGFTSGTTGRPKLVALSHRSLVSLTYSQMLGDGFRPEDRMAFTLPMGFAAGLAATVSAALVGTRMCLYDARAHGIDAFGPWMQAQRPAVMYATPALLRSLLRSNPSRESFATLRAVLMAGEAAYAKEVEPFRALLPPDCFVHNWYGSSEGSLLSVHAIRADGPELVGAMPAGRPAFDREIVLVDEQGRPVPTGETGVVTATCRKYLFSGYWHDAAATRAAVTENPDGSRTYRTSDVGRFDADGVLHLLGRRDHSVKIRGHLVDPAEVDVALFALPEVREAVVVGAARDGGEGKRLVAYVVPAADQPSAARLRAALRGSVPGYMVPEAVVYLDALPRTDRGKIDRSALPPPPPRSIPAGDEIPRTRWEEMVAEIWAEVLELELIGRSEDFFELGGDSLAAEALISRIIADLGVNDKVCTTTLLIQAPTVAEFAARLRSKPAVPRGPLVPLHRAGSRPPLFIMAGGGGLGIAFVPWARLLGPDQPTWALQWPALEGRGLPERSVRSIARSHITAIRRVQPHGPYHLAGHSFGAIAALEMAHQLKAAGEQVALLAIIDSFPPDPAAQPERPQRTPIQSLRDLAGVTLMSALSTPGGRDHWRFLNHAGRLASHYTCPPWNGRTLVLLAESEEKQLRSLWAPHLTGTWRMVEVPGDHLTITRLPWAEAVAKELEAELAAVQVR
jgi:acyl-coenzyme A synthetase/AMP-(fatty) acid ligase/thioesterase domain-containing protein